jgi:hypothetical protein
MSFLLLGEVMQHVIEEPEPLRPEALVVAHPVVNRLERAGVEPVHASSAVVAALATLWKYIPI